MAAAWIPIAGGGTAATSSAVVIVITSTATEATSWGRSYDYSVGQAVALNTLREKAREQPDDDIIKWLRSPKAKALERRRQHADFVGVLSGTPTLATRPIKKHRPCCRFTAWRVRALAKLMGTVSTRVRGSVPPGR